MKTLENSSPIHRTNRITSVWGRYALAAILPLAVVQPAMSVTKVSDLDLEIAAPAAGAGNRLDPKTFVYVNNILVDQDALAKAVAAWTGRDLNAGELEQATTAVAEHLRAQGHSNVMVSLAKERGNVRVRIDNLTPTEKAYAQVTPVTPVVDVRAMTFEGVTQALAEELQTVVTSWIGKALTIAQLQEPVRAVTDFLKAKGLSLAQAFLPPQDMKNGELRIKVVQGEIDGDTGIAGVLVRGVGRTNPTLVARTIAPGAVPGEPVRAEDLEQRLILANELPGLTLKASLVPGSKFGTTAVEVVAQEERAKSVQMYVDNHGNRFTGQTRVGIDLDIFSPSGNGDLFSLGGTSTKDSGSVKLAYSVPIDYKDARIGASISASNSNMAPQNINVRFDGKSQQVSVFGQLPLTRTADSSVTAVASVDNKKLSNNFEGMLFDKREINSVSVGVNGAQVTKDRAGQMRWATTLTTGQVTVRDRENSLNPRLDTQGSFTKLAGDYRLTRPLSLDGEASKWSLSARASGQLHVAGANLDNAEKFQLGGPDGVRGYPVGEGWGDTGYLASLEVSRPFTLDRVAASRFMMFVDTGTIMRNPKAAQAAEASDGIPNTYSLHSAGVGVKLDFTPATSMQLTAASPLGKNPAQVNGQNTDARGQSQTRYWLSFTSRF